MTPLDKIREAVLLLAQAQRELRDEFGAEVRPINDALDATYKAKQQIKTLMDEAVPSASKDRS